MVLDILRGCVIYRRFHYYVQEAGEYAGSCVLIVRMYVCFCPFSICLFVLSVHCCIYLHFIYIQFAHNWRYFYDVLVPSASRSGWAVDCKSVKLSLVVECPPDIGPLHSTAVSRPSVLPSDVDSSWYAEQSSRSAVVIILPVCVCARVLAMVHAESPCAIESHEIRALIVAESDIREASS